MKGISRKFKDYITDSSRIVTDSSSLSDSFEAQLFASVFTKNLGYFPKDFIVVNEPSINWAYKNTILFEILVFFSHDLIRIDSVLKKLVESHFLPF